MVHPVHLWVGSCAILPLKCCLASLALGVPRILALEKMQLRMVEILGHPRQGLYGFKVTSADNVCMLFGRKGRRIGILYDLHFHILT
jgi:hypothetical protein